MNGRNRSMLLGCSSDRSGRGSGSLTRAVSFLASGCEPACEQLRRYLLPEAVRDPTAVGPQRMRGSREEEVRQVPACLVHGASAGAEGDLDSICDLEVGRRVQWMEDPCTRCASTNGEALKASPTRGLPCPSPGPATFWSESARRASPPPS